MSKIEQIVALIEEQRLDITYTMSERLRTAAFYASEDIEGGITTAEWVAACEACGINSGTARNRLSEMRRIWGIA